MQDVEGGYIRSLAFVVPPGATWPLPLYELALMLAGRAFEMCATVDLHFVTPETVPLELFGGPVSRELRGLLDLAGITLHAGLEWTPAMLDVQRVITLPRLEGPRIAGLPSDEHGFLVADEYGQVVPGVYAAGDVTGYEVKQGGIACQQADAAASHIAAPRGRPGRPAAVRARAQGPAADRALGALPQARRGRLDPRHPRPELAAHQDRRPRAGRLPQDARARQRALTRATM